MSNNEDLKQKLRDNLAALEADERGEPTQFYQHNWHIRDGGRHVSVASLIRDNYHCRPAPKPSPQYWSKPEHVPGPVCWIRGVHGKGEARHPDYRQHLIVGFSGDVAYQTISGGCEPVACSSLFSETRWEHMEHSTDRIHWHPCTVPAPPPEPLHKPDNVETLARVIYEQMRKDYDQAPAWVEGGNSLMQENARDEAKRQLKQPTPHNPAGLTPEQVETEKGYRLLYEDEITDEGPSIEELDSWNGLLYCWSVSGYFGASTTCTYRTKLSREELAKKRRGE